MRASFSLTRPGVRALAALVIVSFSSLTSAAKSQPQFGFEQVVSRAKALADKPFQPPEKVPQFLRELDRETWDSIRYRPDKAQWRGSDRSFEVQFFHPGLFYQNAVPIYGVNQYGVGRLPFEKARFEYPSQKLRERTPDDLGYAGFRLHYPINRGDYKDEVAVFLGASYFRAIGAGQHYGLSARGLAVDTALSKGEEFPYFKAFWLEEPPPDAEQLTVYALLDSQSVTGAYRFVITPGKSTTMDVQARLFTRKPIEKLGIAPLTSMYMFGENQDKPVADYRPELHDSDGLLIATGAGEWLWRPLRNPSELAVNSFGVEQVRGFGLLQRDRRFHNYEDLDHHYERRPSAWVVPQGNWGKGRVELVQIPSKSERNDNVVAFWVPAEPIKAGQTLDFAYRVHWQMHDEITPPGGRVVATRIGAPTAGDRPEQARKVVLDFEGGPLTGLAADAKVVPRVDVGKAAKLLGARVFQNEVTGGWRLVFHVLPNEPSKPLEVRAFLGDGNGGALTETWTYAVQP